MSLATAIIEDRVPIHEPAGDDALRELDPTEYNMERLNAKARGSGRTYHTILVDGPLRRANLERALDALTTRHPLLRSRIVRESSGALRYAPTRGDRHDGTARIPLHYVRVDDVAAWPRLVEDDMNAGPIASGRGPLFAFAVIEPHGLADGEPGLRALVMIGHHCVCDGTSAIALLSELFEQLSRPLPLSELESPPFTDPFAMEHAVPELAELEAEAAALRGEADGSERRARLERLGARLEALEADLGARRAGTGHLPRALLAVQGLISSLAGERRPATGIVPEIDLGTGASRYEHARTAFLHRTLDRDTLSALRAAAKQRGLTLHGAFGGAVLLALRAHHTERAAAGLAPAPLERLALASAVSLRPQLVPPLVPSDLRMAVDIQVSRVAVEPGASLWQLAQRFGEDVTRAVASGRALSSSFRTTRRDFDEAPPGVPLPLLSNLGKVALAREYGPLRLLELSGAMAAHGSFQLAMLLATFDGRLGASFYCETPTVSRTSLERFAARVLGALDAAARGEDPRAPD